MKKHYKIALNTLVGVVGYIALSFSMFLGLQISPLYGNIAIVTLLLLAGIYIWLYRKYIQ